MCQERSPNAQHVSAMAQHRGLILAFLSFHIFRKCPPQTQPPPKQPPCRRCQVWAGREQLSSFQLCNPCAAAKAGARRKGPQRCLQPAPAAPHLSSGVTAFPTTSALAPRRQKEELPSLNSKPRQTPSVLPFGENLGGLVCNKIRAFSVRPTQSCVGPGSKRVRKPFPTLLQLNRRDGCLT